MHEYQINVAKNTGTTTFNGAIAYSFVFRTDWMEHAFAERTFRLLDRTLPSPEYKVTISRRSMVRYECTSEFRTGIFPEHSSVPVRDA